MEIRINEILSRSINKIEITRENTMIWFSEYILQVLQSILNIYTNI